MRVQLIRARREEGAVAVMTAILAVVLIGVAAFTTDFGMAYAQRQALATGADSAALGVVRAMYTSELKNPTGDCETLKAQYNVVEGNGSTKAKNIALAQVNANAPFGATIASSDVTAPLVCLATGPLQVTVTANRTIDPILGGVLGGGPMNVSGTAVAALGVANQVRGLSPLALCSNQAQVIMDAHVVDAAANKSDRAMLVAPDKVWKSGNDCDAGGSGNWGWLDFGQGNGADALGDMIIAGYNGTITLDTSKTPASFQAAAVPGNKGSNSHTHNAMQTIMDKVVTYPVYSKVTGNGNNTEYTVIGFMSVQMCGYDKTIKGSCHDPAVPMAGDDLQVRFANYTPAGQMGTGVGACAIGGACAFNAYVTKLLR